MDCILMIWFYDNKNCLKLQVNVVRDENRLPALANSTKRIKFKNKGLNFTNEAIMCS